MRSNLKLSFIAAAVVSAGVTFVAAAGLVREVRTDQSETPLRAGVLPSSSKQLADTAVAPQVLDSHAPVVETIRAEALRVNDEGLGHPLPLAAHWNRGTTSGGFTPDYQLGLIAAGHHLLPEIQMPPLTVKADDPRWMRYYGDALPRLAAANLPLTFIGSQWESLLTSDKAYFNLPPEQNPNVVTTKGEVLPRVSPFGPVEPWRQVGLRWATSPMMEQAQEWYPAPPKVIFISNNEHAKLRWHDVEEDYRYVERYGYGRDDNFKRSVVAQGWTERYRALQQGIREGLRANQWKTNASFVGFSAFGPSFFGRWGGWQRDSLYAPNRISPYPLFWDGGSVAYYLSNSTESMDYTVWSPQIEAMNWKFMLEEAYGLNPNFWFEMSTWDGYVPGAPNDKRKVYEQRGQLYKPERYGAMVQFGMWLLRPRAVREYRNSSDDRQPHEPYFLSLLAAVDRVYNNPTLREFWQRGNLVPNRAHAHPYQAGIPDEYKNVDRWFLLDTNLDPPRPWSLKTELPVFSLALVMGEAPQRRWLVYAHSPTGDRDKVTVTIPQYRRIDIASPVAGAFYLVSENGQKVSRLP